MDFVPFLDVDTAKGALGLDYATRLHPAAIDCLACGETRRAAQGDHLCLWCRVSELWGYDVYPCKPR